MVMRQEENSLKRVEALEALHKIHKIPPCAASYKMGWQGLQAVRYRDSPASEFSLLPVSQHWLVLIIRPPEKLDLRYEGMKRDIPPPAGSIAVASASTISYLPISSDFVKFFVRAIRFGELRSPNCLISSPRLVEIS
jgi:hypothetical protein